MHGQGSWYDERTLAEATLTPVSSRAFKADQPTLAAAPAHKSQLSSKQPLYTTDLLRHPTLMAPLRHLFLSFAFSSLAHAGSIHQ